MNGPPCYFQKELNNFKKINILYMAQTYIITLGSNQTEQLENTHFTIKVW